MNDKETLQQLRQSIDETDARLVEVLKERLALVDRVGALKRETGTAVHDGTREREILSRVRELGGSAYGEDIATLYEAMFSLTRARERK